MVYLRSPSSGPQLISVYRLRYRLNLSKGEIDLRKYATFVPANMKIPQYAPTQKEKFGKIVRSRAYDVMPMTLCLE